MKKIMIVEDEEAICNELSELLESNNYKVLVLKDFKNPINEILECLPDLILLDINIPYMNGETLLQSLRKTSNIPVIMVTSRNSETDEALSITYGADDYITKPYNPNILLLRIGAVLKRVNAESNIMTYKDLSINIGKGIIKRNDTEIILTKNEMIIFSYLLNHQNKIVTRDELMTDLWNNEEFINDNALTVNISRLRAKLKSIGYEDAIDTRKGMGYILS
ncbi:MAG: response regulator transcription factor [Clostridium sp.]|nr:response regulator transcription factor [Clostridium sp.]MCM1444076.1 response regulator transcription factor [Candidatus Amulumruptor caecigallinarius]